MVEFWTEQIKKGIELTKRRIKRHEKSGNGNAAIREKAQLKKQERHRDVRSGKTI